MVSSTRVSLAIGLGLFGLCFLVGPSLAQQDGAVRKAAAGQGGAAAPAAAVPTIMGTVDLDAVFRGYEKFKFVQKDYQTAALARQNELMKIEAEGKEEVQMLGKLTPGTEDFKKHENRVTELKARVAAGREQAQREFQARECENLATIYKEVQLMITAVAQWRKLSYVVRVTNLQPSGSDPRSVMAAIEATVVYFDPRNDITNDVIYNLNRRYKASSAAAPAAGGPGAGAAGAGAAPANAGAANAPAAGGARDEQN